VRGDVYREEEGDEADEEQVMRYGGRDIDELDDDEMGVALHCIRIMRNLYCKITFGR